jgi:hypothetical protein
MATLPKNDGTERSVHYDHLRQSYDSAFRELVVQTRRRQQLIAAARADGMAIAHVNARIQRTAAAVRYRRDLLADFLLKSPERTNVVHSRIQQAAYFMWLNAGCPDGPPGWNLHIRLVHCALPICRSVRLLIVRQQRHGVT